MRILLMLLITTLLGVPFLLLAVRSVGRAAKGRWREKFFSPEEQRAMQLSVIAAGVLIAAANVVHL